MNAFLKQASLTLATATMPFSAPLAAQDANWPPPSSDKDWVFIPPMSEVSEPERLPEAQGNFEPSTIYGTPVVIEAGQCAYVLSLNFVAAEKNPQQQLERQLQLNNWLHDNQSRLRNAINLTSLSSIHAVAQQGFTPVEVCDRNNEKAQGALLVSFKASSTVFVDSLKKRFPDIITNVQIKMDVNLFQVEQDSPPTIAPSANMT